jgi:hypothetical protein
MQLFRYLPTATGANTTATALNTTPATATDPTTTRSPSNRYNSYKRKIKI